MLRRLTPALVLLGAVLAVSGWLGVRALQAQDSLLAARADLTEARDALLDRRLDTARTAIEAAGGHTATARSRTSDPVWRLAAALPGVGATPASVRGVAVAADDLAREVLPQALEAAEQVDPARLRTPDGAVDLAVVRAAAPAATASAERTAAVLAALRNLPRDGVVAQVAGRRAELEQQTADLHEALDGAAQALALAPLLMGEDRPRRYLLIVQQVAESRGTGGIAGGFVELEADAGRLSVLSAGSNRDLQQGLIAVPPGVPPEFVDLYADDDAFLYWQNANVSPDLPVVARVYAARWAAQGGAPLDGVAVLDAVALASILQGTPPLQLADRAVAPDQLVEYLSVGQYEDFQPADSASGPLPDRSVERKDALEDVAAAAAGRLTAGGGDTLALLRGVADAVRSGHLRMASDEPALGPALAAAGVDGALPGGDAPVVYPVVNNATAGKLDHFLDRTVSYRAGPCEGGRRRSTVTVTLVNDVPDRPLPPYLTIRLTGGRRIDSRTSALALSVYATRGAELVRATLDGRPFAPEDPAGPLLVNAEEAGLPFWNLELELPPGQPRTLVLELDEPAVAGDPRVVEQPLSRPLERLVDVPACG